MALSQTPHDSLFRALLDDPERAATLIRERLPAEVVACLADVPPEPVDGTFIDDTLRSTRSDRLFRTPLKSGGPAFLYVLLEHKSTPDPSTPLQLLGYMVRIWEAYAEGRAGRLRALPPIFPLVVYHGVTPWAVPPSALDCLAIDDGGALEQARSLRYTVLDLGPITVADLSQDRLLRSGLTALKYAFQASVTADVLESILSGVPDGHPLEIRLMTYILTVHDTSRDTVMDALRRTKPERWEAVMGTVAEEIFNEGKAEGIAKGKAEGIAEGIAMGKAQEQAVLLLRLLERRFGPLPSATRRHIATASPDTLQSWFDAALDATTLDEVFRGTRH
ncbi:Rpn family recombination-promoting nuclease/putative transposase [Rhodospira trueperi]|uniref:Predicted transposase YdaD n=1 Tax=Rhodospira trueperi TaxID=69960 RepID=A0A1G7A0A3_9PROT|nr:Rpn family recombination-promoting nuclease/putative transposase [Rhodospira trueperi]SDE07326.1 Predicted transposase YdaD [Rhodospira trueperi]